jgi:hypothetical protein
VRLEGLGQLKKSNYLIGTRSRDLPACSTVPQPTTLLRAPSDSGGYEEFYLLGYNIWLSVESKPHDSYWLLAWLTLRPYRWRRQVTPKRRLTFNGLHGVISQVCLKEKFLTSCSEQKKKKIAVKITSSGCDAV